MADKKISALTGAATPLGGTEVLPIVQSGSTVKVSVANLTAGRSVAASELTTTGNILAGATSNAANCRVLAENATGQQLGARYAGVATHYLSVESNGDLNFNRDSTEFARFVNSNTDFALKTGNLVPSTAGKGIDFSANTGTAGMTSELLNWYEEGTYIATLTPQTSGSITVNSANNWNTLAYTRIGRVVYVQGGIRVSAVSSPSGSVVLNLPFTAANLTGDAGISVGIAVAESLGVYNQPFAMYVAEGTATAFIQYMNLGSRTSVPGSDFSGNEEMQFNITYIAA